MHRYRNWLLILECAREQTMIAIRSIDRLAYVADWISSLVRASGGG